MIVGSQYIKKKKNKNLFVLLFFSLFLLFLYLAAQVEKVDEYDLHRYYETAEMTGDLPLTSIILTSFGRSLDFVYPVILHLAYVYSIPFNAVTALTCSLSFIFILLSMKCINQTNIEWYVLFVVLMLSPLVWRISISRNMMAFTFLYSSIFAFYRGKKYWGILLTIMCIITHFSVLMYVALFALSYYLKDRRLTQGFVLIVLIMSLLVSIFVPSSLLSVVEDVISRTEGVMSRENTVMQSSFASWLEFGYGDLISVVFSLFFSVVLLFLNRKKGLPFMFLFLQTILFIFFVNSSRMFASRVLMFMPMLWGLNVAEIYANCGIREKFFIKSISLLGLLFVVIYIYAQRPIFFAML